MAGHSCPQSYSDITLKKLAIEACLMDLGSMLRGEYPAQTAVNRTFPGCRKLPGYVRWVKNRLKEMKDLGQVGVARVALDKDSCTSTVSTLADNSVCSNMQKDSQQMALPKRDSKGRFLKNTISKKTANKKPVAGTTAKVTAKTPAKNALSKEASMEYVKKHHPEVAAMIYFLEDVMGYTATVTVVKD